MTISSDDLRQRLADGVLVADGAMGTVLSTKDLPLPYERANLWQPDLVRSVHELYVAAGAQIIEANTFGANAVKLSQYALEHQATAINTGAVRVARQAAGHGVLVAGAMGPCGKALAPLGAVEKDLARSAFVEQATALLDAGVDLIMLETFNDLDELQMAFDVVRSLDPDVPVIAQKVFIEDGDTIRSGLPARVASIVGGWKGVVAVGANCAIGPQRMAEVVQAMADATGCAISAMPTPGLPQRVGSTIRYAVTPAYFGAAARALVQSGASIVGGCCGTGPDHIAEVARALEGMRPAVRVPRTTAAPAATVLEPTSTTPAVDERSPIASIAATGYLKAVELDVPRGLDMTKVLEGAQAMKSVGVNVVDISDGARARLRMNVVCVAHLVQQHAGVEVMMHFACRDRNLLAVQADLLGAYALGIRNILAVTGDPAMIGDYPAATSVYDVDSVGLIRILRRFNEGIDLAGNSIGRATAFTIAAAFDPLAPDPAKERERLARKADEGAHLLYTQPIFVRKALDEAVEAAARHRLPLILGLLPLRSSRHSEFMHNEVPGIVIPDEIRTRIAGMADDDAREYGLDVARQFLLDARPITQGVYLMPPFGNHRIAESVLKVLDHPG